MRTKMLVIYIILAIITVVFVILAIMVQTEKYKRDLPKLQTTKKYVKKVKNDYRRKPTDKELEIYKAQALFALDMQKKRLYKMIPAAADNVLKVLGKDRLNAYISGTPKIIPLPKGIDYDITPNELLSLIAAQKVEDKYYVKFDTSRLKSLL